MKKSLATFFGVVALAGFILTPLAAADAWFSRHENPEAIITPMGTAFFSIFLSLLAWRVSGIKRFSLLSAIGTGVSALAIAIAVLFWK